MAGSTQMISGLSSGIDWRSMVDSLIAIDRQQVTQIETQKSTIESKQSAWQEFNGKLASLQNVMETLSDEDTFYQFKSSTSSSSTTDATDLLGVTIGSNASAGGFGIQIDQLATNEKIGSASFTTSDEALGLSGEFILGGEIIDVELTDTLSTIRDKVNQSNSGNTPSGVSATILTTGEDSYRLVLTAAETGSDGINILDASSSNIVQNLGFTTGTTQIKNTTSSGAQSDAFSSTDTAIGSLHGFTNAPSGTINIGTSYTNIAIDLSSDSLADIKDAINAKSQAVNGIDIASIVATENDAGDFEYTLKIVGTSYTDSGNVLEALGVLEGTHSDVAEVLKGSALSVTTAQGGGSISSSTYFGQVNTGSDANNITNGDTISISGKDNAGNDISGTFTITSTDPASGTQISELLTEIETLFGANGHSVTASIDGDGKITVTDDTSGDSQLEVSLIANNEGGGSLDFGDIAINQQGREMQIQAGQDAEFVVDGVHLSRSSNTVNDVISGVTFDLLKAEEGTTVNVSLTRDKDAIKSDVNSFVTNYNAVAGWISSQMSYDSETQKTGGPLFGDPTLSGISSALLSNVIGSVTGAASDLNSLALLGITLQEDGSLSMDSSTFESAIDTDFNNVVQLFSAQGSGSTGTLQYMAYSRDTEAGSYGVNITQAAELASILGTANLNDADGLDGANTLTITDKSTSQVAIVNLTAGMDLDEVIAAINSEMSRSYTQELTEATGHTTTTASGGPANITSSTKLSEIDTGGDANDISNEETITYSFTNRSGVSSTGSFSITDKDTQTVGDLLENIETTFGNKVTARINSDGEIVVADTTAGTSSISLDLAYNGAGSLSFGSVDTTTSGRYSINIEASDGGSGQLTISHEEYGASKGFTIAQSADYLGIVAQEYIGQDVQGTINGEAATGDGQVLTGDSGNNNTDGLVMKYTGSAIGDIGTLSFNLGFAETLERMLYQYTDSYEGLIETKSDGLELSLDSLDTQIEALELRLDLKQERMINQFVAMETTMSALQNQGNWMQSMIAGL